uniref:Secreted protein n=1 Tax=Panagrellus redivivus TaxID=6233 RepID=A0A7E4V7R7_PANRE
MCTLKVFILFTAVTVSTIQADYYGNFNYELEIPIESLRLHYAANPLVSNKDFLNAGLNSLSTILLTDANTNEEKGRFLSPFEESYRRLVKQVNRPILGKEESGLFVKKFKESDKQRYPASTDDVLTVRKRKPQHKNLLKKQDRVFTSKEMVTVKRICQPRRGHKVPTWCQKCMKTVNGFISDKREEARSPWRKAAGSMWNAGKQVAQGLGKATGRATGDMAWDQCRDAMNRYLENKSRDRNDNNNERPRFNPLTGLFIL